MHAPSRLVTFRYPSGILPVSFRHAGKSDSSEFNDNRLLTKRVYGIYFMKSYISATALFALWSDQFPLSGLWLPSGLWLLASPVSSLQPLGCFIGDPPLLFRQLLPASVNCCKHLFSIQIPTSNTTPLGHHFGPKVTKRYPKGTLFCDF